MMVVQVYLNSLLRSSLEEQLFGAQQLGFLIVHCQITFITTHFSLLHFLVSLCRKHLYPSRALHTV